MPWLSPILQCRQLQNHENRENENLERFEIPSRSWYCALHAEEIQLLSGINQSTLPLGKERWSTDQPVQRRTLEYKFIYCLVIALLPCCLLNQEFPALRSCRKCSWVWSTCQHLLSRLSEYETSGIFPWAFLWGRLYLRYPCREWIWSKMACWRCAVKDRQGSATEAGQLIEMPSISERSDWDLRRIAQCLLLMMLIAHATLRFPSVARRPAPSCPSRPRSVFDCIRTKLGLDDD